MIDDIGRDIAFALLLIYVMWHMALEFYKEYKAAQDKDTKTIIWIFVVIAVTTGLVAFGENIVKYLTTP